MAFLRTLKILKEINQLFEESDFELRTNKKQLKNNKEKLQICSNLNGTVTVVGPCGKGRAIYMTFDGSGIVDLWGGGVRGSDYRIETDKYTPAEIRVSFRSLLTEQYGFQFKNGEHQVIGANSKYTLLPTAKMITQFFRVFCEDDLNLMMSYRDSNTGYEVNESRFTGGITSDGQLVIRAQIEMLIEGMSPAKSVFITFNGSEEVTITNEYQTESATVPLSEARSILVEKFGVSFQEKWHKPSFSIFC